MDNTTHPPRPDMHAYEVWVEVLQALDPLMQSVLLDYMTDHRSGAIVAAELRRELKIPMDLSDQAELRRTYFAACHAGDTLVEVNAEFELVTRGLWAPIQQMKATVPKLLRLADGWRWS